MNIVSVYGISRFAEEKDIPEIMEIINPYRANTLYSLSQQKHTYDYIKSILPVMKENGYPYLVHEIEGEIAGVLTGSPFRLDIDPKFINGPIEDMLEMSIAVKPSLYNSGTAPALSKALDEWSVINNIHSLWGGVIGDNRVMKLSLSMAGYKYITKIENFGKKFGEYHDMKLYQKIIS